MKILTKNNLFVAILFLILSTLLYISRIDSSFIDLSSDQHDIANMAAAYEYSEYFTLDYYLDDASRFDFYHPEFVTLINLLARLTGGYAEAFTILLAPVAFLFLFGSYLLFFKLSGSRLFSIVTPLIFLVIHIPFPIGGDWTLTHPFSMMLKNIYAAYVPWLLLLGLACINKPKLWPLVGIFAGLSFYLHQPSAPTWGIAVWLSLLILGAKSYPLSKRLGWAIVSALLAGLTTIPGINRYLSSTQSDPNMDYELYKKIAEVAFNKEYLNVFNALKRHFAFAIEHWHIIPAIVILIAVILSYRYRKKISQDAHFIVLTGILLLTTTILLPVIDQTIASQTGRFQLFVDLIRNLRYWPFIFVTFIAALTPVLKTQNCFGKLQSTSDTSKWTLNMYHIVIISLIIGIYGLSDITYNAPFLRYSLLETYRVPRKVEQIFRKDTSELIAAIKSVSKKDDYFWGPEWIRYETLRPLVWTKKDIGVLLYSDFDTATEWWEKYKDYDFIRRNPRKDAYQANLLLRKLQEWDIKYAVLPRRIYPVLPEHFPKEYVLLENRPWFLVQLKN